MSLLQLHRGLVKAPNTLILWRIYMKARQCKAFCHLHVVCETAFLKVLYLNLTLGWSIPKASKSSGCFTGSSMTLIYKETKTTNYQLNKNKHTKWKIKSLPIKSSRISIFSLPLRCHIQSILWNRHVCIQNNLDKKSNMHIFYSIHQTNPELPYTNVWTEKIQYLLDFFNLFI